MKIIFRTIIFLFLVIFFLISYLSIVGIETNRFNKQISNKIKNINKDLEIELKEIKLVLDPFKFRLNIKTVGSKLFNQKQAIEIENIKTQISLRSLIDRKFSMENIKISTKSLEIKNLISFIRLHKDTPQLFILEKIIKKGYLIADIKLEFDSQGNIKNNYIINGFVKDVKLSLLKKYNLEKLNFIFNHKKNNLDLEDISFSLNNLSFLSEKMFVKNIKNEFAINGNIEHKNLDINGENLELFIDPFFPNLKVKKLNFNSKNIFSFKLNKKLKIEDFEITSKMFVNKFSIANNLELKKFFPKVKEKIIFSNNKLNIIYKKENLSINGNGNILFQDKNDKIDFIFKKKNQNINFSTSIKIKNNPLFVDFLNFEKDQSIETVIRLEGIRKKNKKTLVNLFSLKEAKNYVGIKNLILNKQLKVTDFNEVILDYTDKEKQKNSIKLYKKNKEYFLEGPLFNANKLIDELLKEDKNKSNILNIDSKLTIDIDKIYLDNEYNLKNFSGYLLFQDQKIIKSNLNGNFNNNEKFKYTINTVNNNKITTLYIDKAEPIVKRYKFIKGYEEGSLDFYSSQKFDESISTLKIYNFKLKELPVLTKILTLASLQGIADILSGEGIRFDEFEMNFMNKENLMTINEIYAIGPAISILMDGYVEKNKLVSLRGTLVPATTINKAIGSIPILGKILVGSKTGEGVFGVSFKIKGPPKDLETTVNPVKTLTPRFITRTLEKIKKD